MNLDKNILTELQRLLQTSDGVSVDQIVTLLNTNKDSANQLVLRSNVLPIGITDTIYKEFDRDDIVPNTSQFVTQGIWTAGKSVLTGEDMFLSEEQLQDQSSRYYYEVWDKEPDTGNDVEAARTQFFVTYGSASGKGAPKISATYPTSLEPTKTIYTQYKNILLAPGEAKFSFKEGTTSDDIYVINVARSQFKQKMDPGNWQIKLKVVDPDDATNYSDISLVDISAKTDFVNTDITLGQLGRVYKVVSGSLNLDNDTYDVPTVIPPEDDLVDEEYGKFYPDAGIVILNPAAIIEHVKKVYQKGPNWVVEFDESYDIVSAEYDSSDYDSPTEPGDPDDSTTRENIRAALIEPESRSVVTILNEDFGGDEDLAEAEHSDWPYLHTHSKLYNAIKAGGYFVGRSVEEIVSTHYFIRVRNKDFNFSNNPTFADSEGGFANDDFYKNPKVFITTIGLYDEDNNLVAVAKLSKPVKKDFSSELLIEVKLDY